MKRLAIPFLLLFAAPALADPVRLPDVQAPPGELVLIDVSSVEADAVAWETSGDAPKNVLPQYRPGGTIPYGLAFSTNTPGKWWVVGAAVKGGKPFVVSCKVTVGTPTPPAPTDPFAAKLQAAYAADTEPGKAAYAAWAATVYGQAAVAVQNGKVATVGALMGATNDVVVDGTHVPKGAFAGPLGVAGTELNAAFGSVQTQTLETASAVAELNKIAGAFSQLK